MGVDRNYRTSPATILKYSSRLVHIHTSEGIPNITFMFRFKAINLFKEVLSTFEQEVLGSVPGSDKGQLGFAIWDFLVAVMQSGFVLG